MYVQNPDDYSTTREISDWTRFPSSTVGYVLQDLVLLHIIQKQKGTVKGYWKLSISILRIMKKLDVYSNERSWKMEVEEVKRIRRITRVEN